MLQSMPQKDSCFENIAANRASFAKCSVGDLALKLPFVQRQNVVLINPDTAELSQYLYKPGPDTGSYLPAVYAADPRLFTSVTLERALFTRTDSIVTVYGSLVGDYPPDGSATGTLQITVPIQYPFDPVFYAGTTLGNATFSGGASGFTVPGLFLQSHRMVGPPVTNDNLFTVLFNIASTNDTNVSNQKNVPFTYSFTYLANIP